MLALNHGGGTSIASGVQAAWDMLKGEPDPRAIIVLSDGKETRSPYLADILGAMPDIPVFAIGWGTAGNSSLRSHVPGAGIGGYLVMADQYDQTGAEEVVKFLAQIIGEATGYEAILDPAAVIAPGQTHDYSFLLGRGDTLAEILLFKPAQIPLKVEIRSPGGLSWEDVTTLGSTADTVVRTRINLPPRHLADPDAHYGEWQVLVTLEDGSRVAGEFPYSILARSRSRHRMACRISQDDHVPGSDMTLSVNLTAGGVPLTEPDILEVQVTHPDGLSQVLDPKEDGPGSWSFPITGKSAGVYRWSVRAEGSDHTHSPYQREHQLTSVIWGTAADSGSTGTTPPGAPGAPGRPGFNQ